MNERHQCFRLDGTGTRRLVALLGLLMFGCIGCRGPLNASAKDRMLRAIERKLRNGAYVHGVDFSDFNSYVALHRPALDGAMTFTAGGRRIEGVGVTTDVVLSLEQTAST